MSSLPERSPPWLLLESMAHGPLHLPPSPRGPLEWTFKNARDDDRTAKCQFTFIQFAPRRHRIVRARSQLRINRCASRSMHDMTAEWTHRRRAKTLSHTHRDTKLDQTFPHRWSPTDRPCEFRSVCVSSESRRVACVCVARKWLANIIIIVTQTHGIQFNYASAHLCVCVCVCVAAKSRRSTTFAAAVWIGSMNSSHETHGDADNDAIMSRTHARERVRVRALRWNLRTSASARVFVIRTINARGTICTTRVPRTPAETCNLKWNCYVMLTSENVQIFYSIVDIWIFSSVIVCTFSTLSLKTYKIPLDILLLKSNDKLESNHNRSLAEWTKIRFLCIANITTQLGWVPFIQT